MKIKYKKNGNFEVEFNEYFKSVDELKNFIKEHNKFINVEVLTDKISEIYDTLTKLDGSIKSSVLDWLIVKEFNFKFKRPNNLNFWLERGFGINEFNESVGNKIKDLDVNTENTFKYNKYTFNMFGKPCCNLCNSDLVVKPTIGRYEIIECGNTNCASHKNSDINTIKQLAFLPINMFKNKNKRVNIESKLTKEYWLLKGFTYNEALIEIQKCKTMLANVSINSFDYYKITTDMNEEMINIKIKELSKMCVEYWLKKGYTKEEAIKNISEFQKSNSLKGIKARLNNPEKYSSVTETQLGYWLKKGYNGEEAIKKLSERQTTFSLKKCIEKYGEENGKKRFTERQVKWSKTLCNGGNLKMGYSKISQELFYKLLENYELNDNNKIFFATHNKEYKLEKEEGGVWLYDFVDTINKKIIEFNGDMYHGNPKKYKADDTPHPFRKNVTAQQMWDKDKRKIDVAIKNGFEVLVIWDSEYRWGDKQIIINKCINFLKNE